MNAPSRGGLVGARFGVLFGFTSWIVVIGVICACTGRAEYLWPVVVPVLLASLGLGLMVLHVIEPALPGAPPIGGFGRRIAGCVCIAMGVLGLLADGLVVPMLRADRGLGDVVTASGGVLTIPRFVPTLALAVGCAVLARALAPLPRR